jgi:flagellar biosynthesis protein FlhG
LVNGGGDQAEGLRQMLAFSRARTVAVVAGTRGAGATSCLVNLAGALAAEGRRVLAVDENTGANVAQALGVKPRFDLKQVIAGDCELEDALVESECGVTVLSAAAAARALPRLDRAAQQRAVACFAKLDRAADIVLLDAKNDGREPSAFASAAQEIVVVVCPGPSSITGGYAAIKRMTHAHGRSRFRLLVNRATDAQTAALIHENMAQVAAKHLDTAIEFLGSVPHDPRVLECARNGVPAVQRAPACAASRRFVEHAASVAHWAAPAHDASGLDSFMQRAIHGSRLGLSEAGVSPCIPQ